jgi:hypothetical protein
VNNQCACGDGCMPGEWECRACHMERLQEMRPDRVTYPPVLDLIRVGEHGEDLFGLPSVDSWTSHGNRVGPRLAGEACHG